MSSPRGYEAPAIAGSGTIALGVAAAASTIGPVTLLARSEQSAKRARAAAAELCERLEDAEPGRIKISTDPAELAGSDLVVEAVTEDAATKSAVHESLIEMVPDSDLATTTSSLSVAELGGRAGASDRFFGLHVFNPVPKMDLIELCLPEALDTAVAERARAWCEALGKRAVEVPDLAGFVVNRLLFPYLFDAVRLLETTAMEAEEVDECMTLGAGHPMGPLALLDFVGIDVAVAIGGMLHADTGEERHRPPARLAELEAAGSLGRKSGRGFYDYG